MKSPDAEDQIEIWKKCFHRDPIRRDVIAGRDVRADAGQPTEDQLNKARSAAKLRASRSKEDRGRFPQILREEIDKVTPSKSNTP